MHHSIFWPASFVLFRAFLPSFALWFCSSLGSAVGSCFLPPCLVLDNIRFLFSSVRSASFRHARLSASPLALLLFLFCSVEFLSLFLRHSNMSPSSLGVLAGSLGFRSHPATVAVVPRTPMPAPAATRRVSVASNLSSQLRTRQELRPYLLPLLCSTVPTSDRLLNNIGKERCIAKRTCCAHHICYALLVSTLLAQLICVPARVCLPPLTLQDALPYDLHDAPTHTLVMYYPT